MKYLQILFEQKIQLLFIEQRIWFIGNISYFVTQLRRNVLPPFTSSLNVTNLRAGPGRNKAPSFYKFKQPKLISEKIYFVYCLASPLFDPFISYEKIHFDF